MFFLSMSNVVSARMRGAKSGTAVAPAISLHSAGS
jgi:hypothetical protein